MEKRGVRDQMVVATKFTTNYQSHKGFDGRVNMAYGGNNTKSLHVSVRDSLKKLRTDYIVDTRAHAVAQRASQPGQGPVSRGKKAESLAHASDRRSETFAATSSIALHRLTGEKCIGVRPARVRSQRGQPVRARPWPARLRRLPGPLVRGPPRL